MVELALQLSAGSTHLNAHGGAQVAYVLLTCGVAPASSGGATPLHWTLLVDCSPSMRIPFADAATFRELLRREIASEVLVDGMPVWKIEHGIPPDIQQRVSSPSKSVVQALGSTAERLQANDRLSIIAFAGDMLPLMQHHSPRDTGALLRALARVERQPLGNSTRLGPALEYALKLQDSNPRLAQRLLVITDGFLEDEEHCLGLAEQFNARHVAISTLGLSMEVQARLLLALADRTGGNAHLTTDLSKLPALLDHEVAQAHADPVPAAQLSLWLAQGVELRRLYRVHPTLAELPLPPISSGRGQFNPGPLDPGATWLLELQVPAHNAGDFRLLRATLEAPGQAQPATAAFIATYGQYRSALTDPQVAAIVAQVAAWRLHTRALDTLAAGDASAPAQLRTAAAQLHALGEHDLAQQTADAAAQAEHGQLDAGKTRVLRYETRRLTANR